MNSRAAWLGLCERTFCRMSSRSPVKVACSALPVEGGIAVLVIALGSELVPERPGRLQGVDDATGAWPAVQCDAKTLERLARPPASLLGRFSHQLGHRSVGNVHHAADTVQRVGEDSEQLQRVGAVLEAARAQAAAA